MSLVSIGTNRADATQAFNRRPINLRRLRTIEKAGLLIAAIALSGCGKSPYELADVRGTVTINGQPLTHARVMFAPAAVGGPTGANVGKPAFGTLQADGSFVLGTYGKSDGAIVGPHSVTIIALNEPPAPPAVAPKFRRLLVPRQVTVESGKENQIPIELTTEEVAKYAQK